MKHGFTVLLEGVVGSTAYGMAGPNSDIDKLAVGAIATKRLFDLLPFKETHVDTAPDPDYTIHEVRKFCKLALQCNPTATELLWLEDYEIRSPDGRGLIGIRKAFLSAPRVKSAYLGYASEQFRRLEARGDGSFSADTRKRTAKHARHMYRLVHQGYGLYRTGELTVRLENPQEVISFGEAVAAGDLDLALDMLDRAEGEFTRPSALPEIPNVRQIEEWLHALRLAHL